MVWSLSFHLLDNEEILEDSASREQSAIKQAYSVFLTNKRVMFRFDGFGSSLIQSFSYSEIVEVKPCKRLFINYLSLKTRKKDCFLNIPEADYWAEKINKMAADARKEAATAQSSLHHSPPAIRGKRELLDMLAILRRHSVLSEEEFEEKVKTLETLNLT